MSEWLFVAIENLMYRRNSTVHGGGYSQVQEPLKESVTPFMMTHFAAPSDGSNAPLRLRLSIGRGFDISYCSSNEQEPLDTRRGSFAHYASFHCSN